MKENENLEKWNIERKWKSWKMKILKNENLEKMKILQKGKSWKSKNLEKWKS